MTDLVKAIHPKLATFSNRTIDFKWIKTHVGHIGNERMGEQIQFALSHGNGTTKSARDRTNDDDSVRSAEVVATGQADP